MVSRVEHEKVFITLGPDAMLPEAVRLVIKLVIRYEPRCQKTGLRGFRPGPTQTGLYNCVRWLEA